MGEIYIGTSGWQYSHWRGSFYPEDLPQKDWLKFYSKHFDTVEVNSSFYRQTKASTFEKWRSEVPENFTFSIKGNQFITHIKKVKKVEEPLKIFFENTRCLEGGKHVILWQFPPSLKKDIGRLVTFVNLLPNDFRHAFEFRHETWVDDEVKGVIKNNSKELAIVMQDWREWPQITESVGKFVYIRFHGSRILYTSGYTQKELQVWAEKIKAWSARKDVYAYFNNDAAGFATSNALSLKKICRVEYL